MTRHKDTWTAKCIFKLENVCVCKYVSMHLEICKSTVIIIYPGKYFNLKILYRPKLKSIYRQEITDIEKIVL